MRILIAALFAACTATAAFAAPLSDADCEAVWKLADVDKNGSLSAEEAKTYIANFVQVDVDKNGSIDATEFKEGCKAGAVKK